jgi:hypothetical protein
VLAGGTGKARLRLVVEGCQGDIVLFSPTNKDLTDSTPSWITMRLRDQWLGLKGHLEIMTRADLPTVGNVKDARKWELEADSSSFGIIKAVLHDDGQAPAIATLPAEWRCWNFELGTLDLDHFHRIMRQAVSAWRDGRMTDPQAQLLQALMKANLLPNDAPAGSELATLVACFRQVEELIPAATRAPGVRDDGSSHDTPVFVRGDYLAPGEMTPRRMPEILGGVNLAAGTHGDRLALAMEITRSDNPLTARVMVNRIWQHLFGRGLVATADNFGRAGERPSHPELLDYLASNFVRHDWSVKRLIRDIVTSNTWQTVSEAPPLSATRDPDNRLLSHAFARRLQAESIRDSMLAMSGSLNLATGGPSIYNHYAEAVDPDKQPPSGPLDGAGRRSLYLEVRRNFLSDFLTCFDFPRPNNPAGNRSETNVPAQSIALLNDPFVLHQADLWAKHITAMNATDEKRVVQMHLEAFNRAPTDTECRRALAFLRHSGGNWRDLAHAFFNMKEFIFVP